MTVLLNVVRLMGIASRSDRYASAKAMRDTHGSISWEMPATDVTHLNFDSKSFYRRVAIDPRKEQQHQHDVPSTAHGCALVWEHTWCAHHNSKRTQSECARCTATSHEATQCCFGQIRGSRSVVPAPVSVRAICISTRLAKQSLQPSKRIVYKSKYSRSFTWMVYDEYSSMNL